jgi:hypothetical protein
MNPEAIAAVAFPATFVFILCLLFPSTRRALASWIHRRGALSDEAYAELSQIRYEIALLRNEVAELRSLLPGVSSASGRLPGGL